MKRILGLLTLLLLINSCDDGDLTVANIDFSEVAATKCTNRDIIYKIKDSEMLILAIPATTFINDETLEDQPIEVEITGSIQVVYRRYNGEPTSANICDLITAGSPNLLEEWNATSGTIQITSRAIKSVNSTTGITQITGYNHYIVFEDIVFQRPDGTTQTYDGNTFVFGNYNASVSPFAFGFDTVADKCSGKIFNLNSSEAFVLDLADYTNLFQNEVTTTPRTALISATNKVQYKLYSSTVGNASICGTTPPVSPTVTQTWTANNGDATDGTGIIEVTTTESSPGFFEHMIRLKKVTMTRGNSDFYLGDDYPYGTIITP